MLPSMSAVLLLLVTAVASLAAACPPTCGHCDGRRMWCSKGGLTSFPGEFPADSFLIYLVSNEIANITDQVLMKHQTVSAGFVCSSVSPRISLAYLV